MVCGAVRKRRRITAGIFIDGSAGGRHVCRRRAGNIAAFRFGHKLTGSGGENAIYLAGQTIRGVALGIVVTAIAQSLFGGIGLIIAGVPLAGALTGPMLLLSIAQIGVSPVLGTVA